jgi:hypothetical protein
MKPLPDRVAILGLLATVVLCFALVFWFVKGTPSPARDPMLWRETPTSRPASPVI